MLGTRANPLRVPPHRVLSEGTIYGAVNFRIVLADLAHIQTKTASAPPYAGAVPLAIWRSRAKGQQFDRRHYQRP
jgi:hypothetical protein